MAASSSIQLLTPALAILILSSLKLSTSPRASAGSCYKSIISFGDSLTDTGNLVQLFPPDNTTHCHRPPYGETFFNHPTGRCSNGRLIIDFFAESFGLPLVPPYLWRDDSADFRQGVNFAVSGATALNNSFFLEMGLHDLATNVSLGTQLRWFKDILPSLCSSNSSGFRGEALRACCGAGGPYNYISSIHCGDLPTTPCDDPSLYVNWDGLHLTEAAYQLVAQGMLQGPYSNPPINTICPLASTSSGLLL